MGKKSKEYWRDRDLKRLYGLSLETYNVLLQTQKGCCAICGTSKNVDGRQLSVDHDHLTNRVRGLLCNNCNRGIGLFKDNINLLKKAVDYLV